MLLHLLFTDIQTHSFPLTQTHTRTCGHASREVMVSMVLTPGDAGWGLQGIERCKLGERWVQNLPSEGLVQLLLMLCQSHTPQEIQVVGR